MTGYRSLFFRHDCSRDGCQIESLPQWDDLIAAFPRNIRPTDIDAMVEINGRFLFIEQKAAGGSLINGQRRALARLGDQPNTTVVVLRQTATEDFFDVLTFPNPTGFHTVTRAVFIAWLTTWAQHADERTERD